MIDADDSDDELTEEEKNAFEADLLAAEKRALAAMALQWVRHSTVPACVCSSMTADARLVS